MPLFLHTFLTMDFRSIRIHELFMCIVQFIHLFRRQFDKLIFFPVCFFRPSLLIMLNILVARTTISYMCLQNFVEIIPLLIDEADTNQIIDSTNGIRWIAMK